MQTLSLKLGLSTGSRRPLPTNVLMLNGNPLTLNGNFLILGGV